MSWRASRRWSGGIGAAGTAGSLFYAVWPVPAGGWDAAQALDPSDDTDEADLTSPAIWHSLDGIDWSEPRAMPDESDWCPTAFVSSQLIAAADAAGRRVASGGDEACGDQVWRSADGRAWSPVPGFEGGAPVALSVLPGDALRPWRLLGYEMDASSSSGSAGAMVWASTDLAAWVPTALRGGDGGIVLRAARGPTGDVAVGFGRSRASNLTWVSQGSGPWSVMDGPQPPIEAVAWGPAGAMGLTGTWNTDGNSVTGFVAWQLASVAP